MVKFVKVEKTYGKKPDYTSTYTQTFLLEEVVKYSNHSIKQDHWEQIIYLIEKGCIKEVTLLPNPNYCRFDFVTVNNRELMIESITVSAVN